MSGFDLVCDVVCEVGESPVWLRERGELLFIDVRGRRLHRFDPGRGSVTSLAVEEDIGYVAPTRSGAYVAGLRSGVWLLDENGRKQRCLANNPGDPATSRFNDGAIDPRGRLVIGTIDETKRQGSAGFYQLGRQGLVELAGGIMTSNGAALAPDGRTLYHSDTPRFVIYRSDYDPETGEARNERVFARLTPTEHDRGRPDGAAVDATGCYWSALYEGGRVQRYDPDGRLLTEYSFPVRYPTMPAFGGADLKTLFVTSARRDGSGGGLYALAVDTPGISAAAFDEETAT